MVRLDPGGSRYHLPTALPRALQMVRDDPLLRRCSIPGIVHIRNGKTKDVAKTQN